MTRKGIRDAVTAALVAALPGVAVYPFKRTQHDSASLFVCAYFDNGKVEDGLTFLEDVGVLHLVVMAPDDASVDDTLDAQGSVIINTLLADRTLGGASRNLLHTGWAYDRDSVSGWVGLVLAFSAVF